MLKSDEPGQDKSKYLQQSDISAISSYVLLC